MRTEEYLENAAREEFDKHKGDRGRYFFLRLMKVQKRRGFNETFRDKRDS